MQPNADTLAHARAIFAAVAAEVFVTDSIMPLKERILGLVEEEGTPTLAAVARLPGASGDKALMVTGSNVVLFGGLSWDAISAITELQIEGFVCLVPTSPLVYAIEGVLPNFPVAMPGRRYASEHWLPVVVSAGPNI